VTDNNTATPPLDTLTVAAIALLAYMLGSLLHEGAGHGGACLLVGGKPLVLSSVNFECSADTRLVDAGGTLMNFIAAAIFFILGRLTSGEHPRWKYFFWIAMTINLFTATGYFLFSGIGGIGDWADFMKGVQPEWLWRIGMAIFGAATYLAAAWISLLELRPLIGSDIDQRYTRALRLSMIPYFAGGIVMCLAAALNPRGAILIAISAAASTFGGTSGLLWDTQWLRSERTVPRGASAGPLPIRRSWPLIVSASIVEVAFIFLVGPGVRFTSS
jgi:hypothetical protein